MAQASQAEEPSMEDILASIRRIISDEENPGSDAGDEGAAKAADDKNNPVEIEAADDMGDAAGMSQDDLDKLFDMDDGDDESDLSADADEMDDMAAAMADAGLEEDEDDDVLELTEELALSEEDVAAGEDDIELIEGVVDDLVEAGSDVDFVEAVASAPVAEKAPPEPVAFEQPPAPSIPSVPIPDDDLGPVAAEAPLTSNTTGDAVHASLDNLSHMFVGGDAQTVEELIRGMLRPMLKAWLDQNLPGMVEHIVQKEIQRLTRRR